MLPGEPHPARRRACSSNAKRRLRRRGDDESPVFSRDADGENHSIEDSEEDSQQRKMEGQRKYRDLPGNHGIVGRRQEPIRSCRHQRLIRQNNDPRCPAPAKRPHHPEAKTLQDEIEQQESDVHRLIVSQDPQRYQPCRVHRHDQRIMPAGDLDGTTGHELAGGVAGNQKLRGTLQRDDAENEFSRSHAACRSATQLAVKPGPSAVNSDRAGSPLARIFSNTKSTVGEDMLPESAIPSRSQSSVPWSSASADSSATITLAPPGWQTNRSMSVIESCMFVRICTTAGLRCAVTKSGMVRRKITPKPSGSTLQPMTPSVSGQRCSPAFSIRVAPPSPARKITAAAPSPNRLMATMLALVSWSWRTASEQSSIVTNSTLVPGRACASRDAIDRPEAPPAQPRPKTGTRITSDRKPIRRATRASRLGVAIPVEVTVTMVSISRPVRSASASAFSATSTNSASAPSRKASVRSGQVRGWRYQSNGFTA